MSLLKRTEELGQVAALDRAPPGSKVGGNVFSWLFVAEPVEGGLFLALLCGLAWAPLWLGSNRMFAWGINALFFGALALTYELSILIRGRRHPIAARALFVPIGLFLCVCIWILIQMSTSVPPLLQHPIWAIASDVLDRPLDGSISVNRDLTTLALLRLLTSACVLWLSLQLCRNERRAHFLLQAVGIIGTVYATYGLISFALFSSAVFWFDVPSLGAVVRSTFVNRNSFATYAGLTFLATCGTLLRLYRHESGRLAGSWRHRLAGFLDITGRQGWLLVGSGFLILVGLLLSGSRGGIMATAFGVFVLLLLSQNRRRRRAAEKIEAIIFVALAIAVCFVFFGDVFVGRVVADGAFDANRLAVYKITLQSIFDAPFVGFGYGTFVDVFPMYRDRSISVLGLWDKAHNTYLEIFQGLGFVVGGALIGSVAWLGYLCVRGASQRQQSSTPCGVAAAALALVGTHALVDFSLQIQAITLTFMALLGAGVAQSTSSRILISD